jgi:hypothetical protein
MSAKFEITGSAGGTIKVIEQVTGAVDKIGKAAEGAVKSTKQLNAEAQRIRESLDPLERINRKYAELEKHVEAGRLSMGQATAAGIRYRQELNQTAQSQNSAFGATALSNLKSYVTGVFGIGAALSVVRGEIDAINARADKRAQLGMTTADAEAKLRKVVGPDARRLEMMAGASAIAEQSRLPAAQVYQAAAGAYGATSSVPLSLAALKEATRQSRDPEAINEIASGIGFIMGSANISDPREAAGLLNQVLAGSPITDEKVPQAFAKVASSYLSPTAGGSAATAGAILAGLSQASADTEGDRSRTGAIDLITKSDEFFKKRGRKYGVAGAASDTIDERIALLMGNPEMAKDFIASTTFEAPVRGGMSRLFLTEEGRSSFAANRAAMSDQATRNRVADETAQFLTGGKLQSGKKANEIIASGSDTFELGKENVLTNESYDKLIGMIADQMGGPAPNMRARAYYGMTTGLGGVDTLEAIHMLQSNRPAGDGETAQKFDAMIGELRGLREQQKSKVATRPE